MAGRADKNKKSRSSRGSTNQSKAYTNSADQRSNRHKGPIVGSPSLNDEKKINVSAERNRDAHPEDMTTPFRGAEKNFNLVVDSVPYIVHAASFDFNGEARYRVSVNGNEEHIFTWDSELKRLKAIDDAASTLPDSLEVAISNRLQSKA